MPFRVSWLKILLIAVLSLLLLTVPFLPFALAAGRGRKAAKRRRAFDAENNNTAVMAMFAHCVAYLESGEEAAANCDYASMSASLPGGPAYRAHFDEAAEIWLDAAYSGRSVSDVQRQRIRAFLDETEELMYDRADRKSRFRLKYVLCLHE